MMPHKTRTWPSAPPKTDSSFMRGFWYALGVSVVLWTILILCIYGPALIP
jgi:hypothetical protein